MKIKPKILLLNPPCDLLSYKLSRASFPLGICYLGTYLKNKGYNIRLIDAQIEHPSAKKLSNNLIRLGSPLNKIEEIINDYKPDVLGISCNFNTYFNSTLEIAELARKKCNVKHIIAGGCYASVIPERIMKSPYIDFLVIGEGEITFNKLLEKLFGKSGTEFDELDGFAYIDQTGSLRINRKKSFLPSDEFFTPDRDLLPVEKYINLNRPHSILTKGKRTLEIITSRGCNAKCTFCSGPMLEGKFRGRKPEEVIEELKLLKQKYDIDEVQFVDDNLTMDKSRAEKIFRLMINEKLNLHWCTPNGIALYALDASLIKLMKKSGCYNVVLPIESGSQYVLSNLIKKPLRLHKVLPLVNVFRNNKISMEVFLVIGMPGETFDNINETFEYIKKLGIFRVHFNYAMPIPSTQLYLEYQKLKKKFGNKNLENNEDIYFDYRVPQISTDKWTNKELKKYVSKKIIKFYIRFILFKPIIFLKEVIEITSNLKLFKEIVRYYLKLFF